MKNQKSASSLIYIVFFFILFLVITAFAVDTTIAYANREKLQNAVEMAALATASAFEQDDTSAATKATLLNTAQKTFKVLNVGGAKVTNYNDKQIFNVEIANTGEERQVRITVTASSQPYFLAFLGISNIKLAATSCASREKLKIKSTYGDKIIWMSGSAAYQSDVISYADHNNYNDTAVLTPLGDYTKTVSYDTSSTIPNYARLDSNNMPLSLGPGGYITMKFPVPVIDKEGPDIYVEESGKAHEGYMVFVGTDKNPDAPYINAIQPGEGIAWVNATCSAEDSAGTANSHIAETTGTTLPSNGPYTLKKVYGSAYFDLKNSCIYGSSSISIAKYIRIIDDNSETAWFDVNPNKIINIYGEASTSTPGADIDYVEMENYVHLIKPSDFGT